MKKYYICRCNCSRKYFFFLFPRYRKVVGSEYSDWVVTWLFWHVTKLKKPLSQELELETVWFKRNQKRFCSGIIFRLHPGRYPRR